MDPPTITVHAAERSDLPIILRFIHKKARFDGVPHAVEATEATLGAHLFSEHPSAFVLLAELDDRVVGFALYFLTFSSFLSRPGIWLDDLYIDEDVRGRGVGGALLTHLAGIARTSGYGRVEWTTAVDNERGMRFYQRHGAEVQETVRVLRFERRQILALSSPSRSEG